MFSIELTSPVEEEEEEDGSLGIGTAMIAVASAKTVKKV
jgi:hypothetical protein